MTQIFLSVFAFALIYFPSAFAQQALAVGDLIDLTVGDLIDKGGRKLSADEVKRLYSGATVSGVQGGRFPDTTFQNTYFSDGKVSGNAWNKGVWFTSVNGTWAVNELGQMCPNLINSQGQRISTNCQSFYTLAGQYYMATSDERSTPVLERNFAK